MEISFGKITTGGPLNGKVNFSVCASSIPSSISMHSRSTTGTIFRCSFFLPPFIDCTGMDFPISVRLFCATVIGRRVPVTPASPLKLAINFFGENVSSSAVWICAAGDEKGYRRAMEERRRVLEIIERRKAGGVVDRDCMPPYDVKYENELTEQDLEKNLYFQGGTEDFSFHLFDNQTGIPVRIKEGRIEIGDYSFSASSVGINACFPNPHNRERFVLLCLRGSQLKSSLFENWVDYTVYEDDQKGEARVLIHGHFEKEKANWRFSQAGCYGTSLSGRYCIHGRCKAPVQPAVVSFKKRDKKIPVKRDGDSWILGNGDCRFPSIAIDGKNRVWLSWEENGDIAVSSIDSTGEWKSFFVKEGDSDSYNPVLAATADNVWVFYLDNLDGFYRLYCTYINEGATQGEILISGKGPFDAITPAVASTRSGKLAVAWSEWKANLRYLKYRVIEDMVPGDIQPVSTVVVDGYVNAWSPSLALDEKGVIAGAWNQHYPATMGVYAGDLVGEAREVNDNGGYPSLLFDGDGRLWVFWESSMWDVLSHRQQRIEAAWYDSGKKKWSLPYNLSSKSDLYLNQTPRAVLDGEGVIWVVWSGRMDEETPWRIYLSRFMNGVWTGPEPVSPPNETARAPVICAGKGGPVWIAWHAGTGSDMKIRVKSFEVGG